MAMRALTMARDGQVSVDQVAEPTPAAGDLLVEAIALGVCGTDRGLMGSTPKLPPGRDRLILGHESLGRVLTAPQDSGFEPGDVVVGTVRRPDPVPCRSCAAGESDLCENGKHTSRGISWRDGYGSERYALDADFAVRVDQSLGLAGVLVEPTSIVAKAWEQVDRLTHWSPTRVLVLGAGPIGLLAALLSVQRGHDVDVVDRVTDGSKPALARAMGAAYYPSTELLEGRFDVVFECTGVLTAEAIQRTAPGGVACLVGGGHAGSSRPDYQISDLATDVIRYNKMVVGTVNSNRHHFQAAHEALRQADRGWLQQLLGPRVPLEDWEIAVGATKDQIKAVIQFADV